MSDKALKAYMEEHFDFKNLKKSGFFKGLKSNNYEEQAKKVCEYFGLESIYDYSKHEIRCHISYAKPPVSYVDENGHIKTPRFVETLFPNQLHI